MINIKKYLRKYNPDQISRNKYYYNELNDFYGELIPEKYIDLYNKCELCDFEYIDENLKTHDYKKLQDILIKEFGDEITKFEDYDGSEKVKSFYIVLNRNIEKPKLNISDINQKKNLGVKFLKILEFFNYTYSTYSIIDKHICLYIEPIYSEEVSPYFNKCHRIGYHFTYKENVEKILNSGLRIRSGKYRKFSSRIFLWASEKSLTDNINNVNDFIEKIFGTNKYNIYNVGIIKVDLNNTNYPIYKDTAMTEKEALFIYNNVPAELCKEINLNK